MAKKLTEAEREAEARALARIHERDAARDAIVAAAIRAYYPDGDAPRWFSYLASQCKVEATTAVHKVISYRNEAHQRAVGEARDVLFHEAFMPLFEEAFAKLLARKLGPAA